MKRCTNLVTLFLALTATAAHAQFMDNFTTPRFVPEWTFGGNGPGVNYPAGIGTGSYDGSPGINSENAKLYTTGNGAFVVTMSQGNPNQPTLTFAPGAPANWDIYCTVAPDATFTTIAGLTIFKDTNNYVQFVDKYNANNGSPYNYAAAIVVQNGTTPGANYDNLTYYGSVGLATPVTLHINKTGNVISFSNMEPGGNDNVTGTASSTDTEPAKAAIYALLSDPSNLHLALSTDNYYSTTNNSVVTFSDFNTSLNVVKPTVTDPFTGPKLNPAIWTVANEDTTNEFVGNGIFSVHTGTGYNINEASATTQATVPSDYDLEVAVDAPYDVLGSAGVAGADAGLQVSSGTSYFQIFSKQGGGGNAYPDTYLVINGMQVGGYDNFQQYYPYVGDGPSLYRIKKVGTTISLSITKPGQSEFVLGTASASDTDPYKVGVYAFLSNMSNQTITLFNHNSYTGTPAIADIAFSRFYTTLPLVGAATVTGTIALEGVSNLSAISAGAPLGTFHVSFRNPGTTTEVLGSDVTLTASGSANGSFFVTGVPAGTYDVNIKGAKNLSFTYSGVVVGNTGTIPATTLAAGDTDGNNVVDTTDFNTLVGVFGNAYSATQPNSVTGYDPTADLNFDGVIDTADFNLLVGEFGNSGS